MTVSAEAGDDVISLMPEGKINVISDTDSLQDDSISDFSDLLEDLRNHMPHT